MPFPLPPSSLVSPPCVIFVCCAPPLPMVMVATPLAGNWTGTRLFEGRCEVVCSGLVVWLRVSRGVLGVLGVVNFRLFECVLVALRCRWDSAKQYSRSGTPRNNIRGVGVREILFSEWDSEKYYSRSGTPRNIILGVGVREILCSESAPLSVVLPCDWVLLWCLKCGDWSVRI